MTGRSFANNPGRSKVRDVTTGRRVWRALTRVLSALLVLGVGLGFLGWLHPAGDSLALLRLPLGALCLLMVLCRLPRLDRLVALAACGAAFATTLPLILFGGAVGDVAIYSKNLWYRNADLPRLAVDIQASGADVVALQELSRRNEMILEMLAEGYPHQHLCRFSGWSGNAVLSRRPITDRACTKTRALAAARIADEFWVASIHLSWPYPYRNAVASDAAAEVLADLEGPVVLAGDFNIFPWASSVQQMNRASGTRPVGPVRPTYWLRGCRCFWITFMRQVVVGSVTVRSSARTIWGCWRMRRWARGRWIKIHLTTPSMPDHAGSG